MVILEHQVVLSYHRGTFRNVIIYLLLNKPTTVTELNISHLLLDLANTERIEKKFKRL